MAKMTENTAKALETARELFGTEEFSMERWENANIGLTLRTAMNHKAVTAIKHNSRQYYSTMELVELINSCSGTDCYNVEYNLKMDENGRAYEDCEFYTYCMA